MADQTPSKEQRKELRQRRQKKEVIVAIACMVGFLVLLPIFPYIGGLVGFHIEISEGDRIGQVVKLSNKGFIWRTWEGTLGVTQSGAYVDAWDFSMDPSNRNKEALLSKLRQAYTTGTLVRIHYSQKLLPLYWRGKTSYFVEDVQFARESNRS